MKDLANDTWKRTISLIESDTRSLEDIKESLTNKVADEILILIAEIQKLISKFI